MAFENELASWDGKGILGIPYGDRCPEDTAISSGCQHPHSSDGPESGISPGHRGILRTPSVSWGYAVSPGHRRRPGDTLISWGCHRCPEDTGSFRQYKNYKTTPRFSALYHTRSSQQAQPRGGLAKVPATLLCPLPGLSCECVCRARRAAHPATATTQSPRERLAVPLLLAAPVACSQSRYAHGK